MLLEQGWLVGVRHVPSPRYDRHPDGEAPTLLVVYNIGLPPDELGGPRTDALSTGTIDPQVHPFFAEIAHLRVSAHCLTRHDSEIIQYVPLNERAWHAGIPQYQGRGRCSDFSIGIEFKGADTLAYTDIQYQQLTAVTWALIDCHPDIAKSMTGHYDIAPDRKTDPGPAFDWARFRVLVSRETT